MIAQKKVNISLGDSSGISINSVMIIIIKHFFELLVVKIPQLASVQSQNVQSSQSVMNQFYIG